MLAEIPVLEENPDVATVADALIARSLMPESAARTSVSIPAGQSVSANVSDLSRNER